MMMAVFDKEAERATGKNPFLDHEILTRRMKFR